MIDYISGKVSYKSPNQLVIDIGGIGYMTQISLYTYSKIEQLDKVKLFTHYYVNQQDYIPALYGFFESLERDIFRLLISVSGISVNTARIILSTMEPKEVQKAILGEDEIAFRNVKGVGSKTAKRIILDLKDKVQKDSESFISSESLGIGNTLKEEALSALSSLQIPKPVAIKAINHILNSHPEIDSVEYLIKMALKQLK